MVVSLGTACVWSVLGVTLVSVLWVNSISHATLCKGMVTYGTWRQWTELHQTHSLGWYSYDLHLQLVLFIWQWSTFTYMQLYTCSLDCHTHAHIYMHLHTHTPYIHIPYLHAHTHTHTHTYIHTYPPTQPKAALLLPYCFWVHVPSPHWCPELIPPSLSTGLPPPSGRSVLTWCSASLLWCTWSGLSSIWRWWMDIPR